MADIRTEIREAAERDRRRDIERLARDIYTTGLPAGDCTYPGCQLSAGHPLPHCVGSSTLEARRPGSGAEYWMVDDEGNVLRRL